MGESSMAPPRNLGDLFTQCRGRFGITPDEVAVLLGARNTSELAEREDLAVLLAEGLEMVERQLTLASGRVLRRHEGVGDLDEALGWAERVWRALQAYRFAEFGHWAEMWASLHKQARQRGTRRNPFEAIVSLARQQCDAGGKENEGHAG